MMGGCLTLETLGENFRTGLRREVEKSFYDWGSYLRDCNIDLSFGA